MPVGWQQLRTAVMGTNRGEAVSSPPPSTNSHSPSQALRSQLSQVDGMGERGVAPGCPTWVEAVAVGVRRPVCPAVMVKVPATGHACVDWGGVHVRVPAGSGNPHELPQVGGWVTRCWHCQQMYHSLC